MRISLLAEFLFFHKVNKAKANFIAEAQAKRRNSQNLMFLKSCFEAFVSKKEISGDFYNETFGENLLC